MLIWVNPIARRKILMLIQMPGKCRRMLEWVNQNDRYKRNKNVKMSPNARYKRNKKVKMSPNARKKRISRWVNTNARNT